MIRYINTVLPERTSPMLVGVSMSVDSVAAFLFFHNRRRNVIPVHYNHACREQNWEMQSQFRKLTERLNLPCITNEPDSISAKTETECRTLRLEFYRQQCAAHNCSTVVTAHHLDDYVESYLLNCFRGQPTYTPISLYTDFGSFKIAHPFLVSEKTDFVEYLEHHDNGSFQQYVVTDETNRVIKGSRRNWIRNVIVPEMELQRISLRKYCREQIQEKINALVDAV